MSFTSETLELNLPPTYSEDQLVAAIKNATGWTVFKYRILKKSLDVRNKQTMHWVLRLRVSEKELSQPESLDIPYQKRGRRCLVVGSGPAGIFAALVLVKSGFEVTLLEQGKPVEERARDIFDFERTGKLVDDSNYAFGEGGAGTFSDGKLITRTKNLSLEYAFVADTMIRAGAPPEIAYLSKPHLGSDNLYRVVPGMRGEFLGLEGQILFSHKVTALDVVRGHARRVSTTEGNFSADYFYFAPGNSDYATYQLLGEAGLCFTTKPFAIGVRVEHPQQVINTAQWGKPHVRGLKSAEYALSAPQGNAVYSFCMCPGGKIVPSAAVAGLNTVNGVSNYKRNSLYANAAIVAAVNADMYIQQKGSAPLALQWLRSIERGVFDRMRGYAAPANTIDCFMRGKVADTLPATSFPFPLMPSAYNGLLPENIVEDLRLAMRRFTSQAPWFGRGIMVGVETKTSSAVKVLRQKNGFCEGLDNVALIGQASGYCGGIVTSAVDGIRTALALSRSTFS